MKLGCRALMVVALAVAVVGAGRGGGSSEASKSPKQIAKDAYQAASTARSVRLSGSVTTNGSQLGLDLAIRQGKAVAGSLTLQGDPANVVVIGSQVYFAASAAYYQSQGEPANLANALDGKWVKLPKNQGKDFARFESLKLLLGDLGHPKGGLSKAGTSTVEGMAVVLVTSSKGGTVAVSSHGTPFPLQLLAGSAGSGSLTFSGWNKPVTIKKPGSFIDLSKTKKTK